MLIDDDRSPFELRCAVSCDGGLTRMSNEDRTFAGQRLFAVADGFGAADRDADPASAAARFVELANEEGGPDNVACVVVDVELAH